MVNDRFCVACGGTLARDFGSAAGDAESGYVPPYDAYPSVAGPLQLERRARVGLWAVVLAGVTTLLSWILPYSTGSDWSLSSVRVAELVKGTATETVCAVIALFPLFSRGRLNPAALYAIRGAASWLIGIGFLDLYTGLNSPPDGRGIGYWTGILAGVSLLVGGVSVQLSGWPRRSRTAGFPAIALIALVVGVLTAHYFYEDLARASGTPGYIFPLGVGLGGVLLFCARDEDPWELFTWAGWSLVGVLHIWAFGLIWVEYQATTVHRLWWSSAGPALIGIIAAVRLAQLRNRQSDHYPPV